MIRNLSDNDLINLFETYQEYTPLPFMLINSNYEVVYANKSFENFSQKKKEDILNTLFGEAIGCIYIKKDGHSCGKNYYCEMCSLRESINFSLKSKNESVEQEMVRDFVIDDEILVRQIVHKTFPFKTKNEEYVGVIITDNFSDIDNV